MAVAVTASFTVLSITAGAGENLAAYATVPLVLPTPDLANSVAIAEISGGTYAVVANLRINPNILGDGNLTTAVRVDVSIINVTYSAAPTTVASTTDDADPGAYCYFPCLREPTTVASTTDDADGFTYLFAGASIAVSQIFGGTYAVVTSAYDTGIRIINITDPVNPLLVVGQTGGADEFGVLGRPGAIAVSEISGGTYAVSTHILGGMQIINITDPANPATVAGIIDNSRWINQGYVVLDEEFNISISETSAGTYMLASTGDGRGMRVVNVTDRAAPTLVAELPDGASVFGELGWPRIVSVSHVSGGTYAVTAKGHDDSVQIINITDPSAPTIVNGTFEIANGFTHLDGAMGVEIAEISGRTYAVVASVRDNGLQIVDITDPAAPAPVIGITDDVRWAPTGYTELSGAWSVAIPKIANGTYAVVASKYDSGVQIINITNPTSPFPVEGIADSTNGTATGYDILKWPFDVAVSDISNRTYAVVASVGNNGLQIIDITNPTSPSPAAGITGETDGFAGLSVRGVEMAEISGRTYAVVASEDYGSIQIIDITDPTKPFPLPSPHSTAHPNSD